MNFFRMLLTCLFIAILAANFSFATEVDIRANGREDFVEVFRDSTVNIEISESQSLGIEGEYWLVANTPDGIYYYEVGAGWMKGLAPSYQGTIMDFPLFSISSEVVSDWNPTDGNFTFYFGIDENPNGIMDLDSLVYDSVMVYVSPTNSSGLLHGTSSHPAYITKRFILFAHGMGDHPESWDHFAREASVRGYNVLRTQVDKCGSIAKRAQELASYVVSVTSENDRFKAVGHSMGGLDLRYIVGNADKNGHDSIFYKAAKRFSKVYTIATPHGGQFFSDRVSVDITCDADSDARKDCGDDHMRQFNSDYPYSEFTVDGILQDFVAFTFQCWGCGGSNDCVVGTNGQHWEGAPQWHTTLSGKHSNALMNGVGIGCTDERDNVDEVLYPIIDDMNSGHAAINTNKQFMISSYTSGKCMDITEAKENNGVVVQQWDCWRAPHQFFKFVPVGNYYQIKSMVSGKCLDVTGASRESGAKIQQWECARVDNQLFSVIPDGNGGYSFRAKHSGKCIDLHGGDTSNGNYFQQYDCVEDCTNQLFSLKERETRFVRIQSKKTGKFMDSGGDSIHQWSKYPTMDQWFVIAEMRDNPDDPNSSVYYRIITADDGRCLNVESGSFSNGADIQSFACIDVEQEKFDIVPHSNGYVWFVSKKTGKCIDLSGGGNDDGTNIQQWECQEGNDNQLWKIITHF